MLEIDEERNKAKVCRSPASSEKNSLPRTNPRAWQMRTPVKPGTEEAAEDVDRIKRQLAETSDRLREAEVREWNWKTRYVSHISSVIRII